MRSVQDGEEASTEEGCQWSLGLSKDGRRTGRMQHSHHCRVYPFLPPDDCSVRGNETSLQGLYGGQTAARVDAASVVVEQPMCLDAINATGSDANGGHLDAPAPVDV
jgi:hypothetical protein